MWEASHIKAAAPIALLADGRGDAICPKGLTSCDATLGANPLGRGAVCHGTSFASSFRMLGAYPKVYPLGNPLGLRGCPHERPVQEEVKPRLKVKSYERKSILRVMFILLKTVK
jgi:hypothetical protein